MIADGKSRTEIAAARGVAMATVLAQIKSIFAKTGLGGRGGPGGGGAGARGGARPHPPPPPRPWPATPGGGRGPAT